MPYQTRLRGIVSSTVERLLRQSWVKQDTYRKTHIKDSHKLYVTLVRTNESGWNLFVNTKSTYDIKQIKQFTERDVGKT